MIKIGDKVRFNIPAHRGFWAGREVTEADEGEIIKTGSNNLLYIRPIRDRVRDLARRLDGFDGIWRFYVDSLIEIKALDFQPYRSIRQ